MGGGSPSSKEGLEGEGRKKIHNFLGQFPTSFWSQVSYHEDPPENLRDSPEKPCFARKSAF